MTVRYIHGILHKALSDAQRKGTVLRNVATLADAPKLSSSKKREMRVWNAGELRDFLVGVADDRTYAAFFLAAHTGMRRGEVLGLRWADVDLDKARLSVRQAIISVAYEVKVSDVKTGTGRRTINLDARTVDVLRGWRKKALAERMLMGPAFADNDLVFPRPDGTPTHPDAFSQAFDRAVVRLGLPIISLHDLRHTHATLLLRAGVPVKVVSERLGHATPAFTIDTYQHVLPGMQAAAARIFERLVAPAASPNPLGCTGSTRLHPVDVKFRYPCSTVAPVPVLQGVKGSGGVDAVGPAAGVGEGSVFSGAVVADGMSPDDLAAGGDLHHVTDNGDLDLAATVAPADPVGGTGEADRS